MWVPVAVWQPCELLYTCYLLTYTHTCLTALLPGLPRWAGTRKVKPIWILLKQETVSGSGISWVICKSATRFRQTTTPVPHHCFYRPDALPAAQPTASKHWRLVSVCDNLSYGTLVICMLCSISTADLLCATDQCRPVWRTLDWLCTMSEQFLNGTSAHYRQLSVIKLEVKKIKWELTRIKRTCKTKAIELVKKSSYSWFLNTDETQIQIPSRATRSYFILCT